jgi:hypothetical protein
MTVLQQEVCIAVIKSCEVEHYDIGFSSGVIGMAGFAGFILYVRHMAVIAPVVADICIDILVAIPAKIGLCAFTEVSMAA